MEARGGIEPPMRVLQTLALPLGNRAVCSTSPKQFLSELNLPRTGCRGRNRTRSGAHQQSYMP